MDERVAQYFSLYSWLLSTIVDYGLTNAVVDAIRRFVKKRKTLSTFPNVEDQEEKCSKCQNTIKQTLQNVFTEVARFIT